MNSQWSSGNTTIALCLHITINTITDRNAADGHLLPCSLLECGWVEGWMVVWVDGWMGVWVGGSKREECGNRERERRVPTWCSRGHCARVFAGKRPGKYQQLIARSNWRQNRKKEKTAFILGVWRPPRMRAHTGGKLTGSERERKPLIGRRTC